MTPRTCRSGILATLTTCAVVLVLTACGASPGEPGSTTSHPASAASVAPDRAVAASAPPDGTPEQAVLDFFAAFDRIIRTGDLDDWTRRWAPSCVYCTKLADVATISAAVGPSLDDAALEAEYADFDVTILPPTSAPTESGTETVVDIEYVRQTRQERDSAAPATEPVRARVSLAQQDGAWIVTDVGGLPTEGEPATSDAAGTSAPTEDDAVAALEQYLELERQVYLTGDSSDAEQMVHDECHACLPRLEMARGSFAAGMRMEGARSTVELEYRTPTAEAIGDDFTATVNESIFVLSTTVHRGEATVVVDGVEQVHPAASYTLDASLWYDGGSWYVVGLAESL